MEFKYITMNIDCAAVINVLNTFRTTLKYLHHISTNLSKYSPKIFRTMSEIFMNITSIPFILESTDSR